MNIVTKFRLIKINNKYYLLTKNKNSFFKDYINLVFYIV